MKQKTPLAEAIDYIQNQEYNYLDGKTLEFANNLKTFLTELLPKEKDVIEEAYIDGCLSDADTKKPIEYGKYFNETFTQK